jgi:molybdopterin-guanine dinucleotide biosynthesis protein A
MRCAAVYTSCRTGQVIPASLNPLIDHYPYAGPINGILSAFYTQPQVPWLIVAVDMPFIDEPSLQFLIDNRDQEMLATCFLHQPQNFPEPLLTIWEPKAGPALLAFANSGNLSPRAFLEHHPVHMLRPPNDQVLRNVNYPRDLDGVR